MPGVCLHTAYRNMLLSVFSTYGAPAAARGRRCTRLHGRSGSTYQGRSLQLLPAAAAARSRELPCQTWLKRALISAPARSTLQRQTPASHDPHPAGPRTARMLPPVPGHSAPNSGTAHGRSRRPRAESDLGDLALQKCPPALCGRNFVPDPCRPPGTWVHPAVPQSAGPAGPGRPSHAGVPLGRRTAGERQGNGLGSGARGRCRPGSSRRARQRYFATSHGVHRVRAALRRPPYAPAPPAPATIGARFFYFYFFPNMTCIKGATIQR